VVSGQSKAETGAAWVPIVNKANPAIEREMLRTGAPYSLARPHGKANENFPLVALGGEQICWPNVGRTNEKRPPLEGLSEGGTRRLLSRRCAA
jgi:hypothetical protein